MTHYHISLNNIARSACFHLSLSAFIDWTHCFYPHPQPGHFPYQLLQLPSLWSPSQIPLSASAVQNSDAHIFTKTSTTSPPSFRNSTGSRSNSEYNSKPYCTHSRPSVALPLQICQIFSISPLHAAPSDPLPPSASLCLLHALGPWGAKLSAVLLPNYGTLSQLTYIMSTPSLCPNPNR